MFSRVASLTAGTAGAQLMQLFLFVMLARELGPSNLGKILLSILVANLITVIVDFGASTFFTRELAFQRLSASQFLGICAVRFRALSALVLFSVLIWWATGLTFIPLVVLLASTQHMFNILQSLPKSGTNVRTLALATLVDRALCLILVFLMMLTDQLSVEGALLSWALSQIAGGTVIYFSYLRQDSAERNRSITEAFPLRKLVNLGIFSLSNVISTSDQLLLGFFGGSYQVGIYGAVSKWFSPIAIISGSITTVASSHAARMSTRPLDLIRANKKGVRLIIVFSLVVIVAGLSAPALVPLILGDEFLTSAGLMPFLAITASIAFLNTPLASLLQYFNAERKVARITSAGGIVYLIGIFILMQLFPENAVLVLAQAQIVFQLATFFLLLFSLAKLR